MTLSELLTLFNLGAPFTGNFDPSAARRPGIWSRSGTLGPEPLRGHDGMDARLRRAAGSAHRGVVHDPVAACWTGSSPVRITALHRFTSPSHRVHPGNAAAGPIQPRTGRNRPARAVWALHWSRHAHPRTPRLFVGHRAPCDRGAGPVPASVPVHEGPSSRPGRSGPRPRRLRPGRRPRSPHERHRHLPERRQRDVHAAPGPVGRRGEPFNGRGLRGTIARPPLFAIGDLNGDGFPDVARADRHVRQLDDPPVDEPGQRRASRDVLRTLPPAPCALVDPGDRARRRRPRRRPRPGLSRSDRGLVAGPRSPLLLRLNNGAGSSRRRADHPVTPMLPAPDRARATSTGRRPRSDAWSQLRQPGVLRPIPPQLFLNNLPGSSRRPGSPIPVPATSTLRGRGPRLRRHSRPRPRHLADLVQRPRRLRSPAAAAAAHERGHRDVLADLLVDRGTPHVRGIPLAPRPGRQTARRTCSGITHARRGGVPAHVVDGLRALVPPPIRSRSRLRRAPSRRRRLTAVGDLDGDGDQDVVVFTAQGNQVLFNDSALRRSPVV